MGHSPSREQLLAHTVTERYRPVCRDAPFGEPLSLSTSQLPSLPSLGDSSGSLGSVDELPHELKLQELIRRRGLRQHPSFRADPAFVPASLAKSGRSQSSSALLPARPKTVFAPNMSLSKLTDSSSLGVTWRGWETHGHSGGF